MLAHDPAAAMWRDDPGRLLRLQLVLTACAVSTDTPHFSILSTLEKNGENCMFL
jgi:hypothetical protein